jgi:hypothetical protein
MTLQDDLSDARGHLTDTMKKLQLAESSARCAGNEQATEIGNLRERVKVLYFDVIELASRC